MNKRRDVKKLIESVAREERTVAETRFVAPCVPGGKVRVRVAGLVREYAPDPPSFEGWGIFLAADDTTVMLDEEADLPLVDRYLGLLGKPMRFVLAAAVRGRTWIAYPANVSDARQRGVSDRPMLVRLVSGAAQFEVILARSDGAAWWFEAADGAADPILAERLRDAARDGASVETVRLPGLTPEMRTAYTLSLVGARGLDEKRRHRRQHQSRGDFETHADELLAAARVRENPEARLGAALRTGGGRLVDYRDGSDETWVVEWVAGDGERHVSVVTKSDLTVASSGICLSGRDRDFDLQSLVGVVERRWADDGW
jgi:hypothetical protein